LKKTPLPNFQKKNKRDDTRPEPLSLSEVSKSFNKRYESEEPEVLFSKNFKQYSKPGVNLSSKLKIEEIPLSEEQPSSLAETQLVPYSATKLLDSSVSIENEPENLAEVEEERKDYFANPYMLQYIQPESKTSQPAKKKQTKKKQKKKGKKR